MISVERCRQLLGPQAPPSDVDVETLRDLLYGLAKAALDATLLDSSRAPAAKVPALQELPS